MRYIRARIPDSIGLGATMPHATIPTVLSERYVIDLSKPWHVAWWAKEFGVSEQLLCAAVVLIGEQAEAVRDYVQRQRKT